MFILTNDIAGGVATIFDTNTGLRYRLYIWDVCNRSRDAVQLDIESGHAPYSENSFTPRYLNQEAVDFWLQLVAHILDQGFPANITPQHERALFQIAEKAVEAIAKADELSRQASQKAEQRQAEDDALYIPF